MTRRNNKIIRRKAQMRAQANVPQADQDVILNGLNTRDARRKLRRYSFQAHVVMPAAPALDEQGNPIEGQYIPEQRKVLKLDRLTIATAAGAKQAAREEKANLLESMAILKNAISVKVEALPYETISQEIYKLIQGYQDMSEIAQRALTNAAAKILLLEPQLTVVGEGDAKLVTSEQKAQELYMTAVSELRQEIKAAKLVAEEAEYGQSVHSNASVQTDQGIDQGTLDNGADHATSTPESVSQSEEDTPRKLGIDAYNEIMANPPEGE